MNLKKKIFVIVNILLIIFSLLCAILIIINKLGANKKSYLETYIGTIEKIDDNRINVSALEEQSISFYKDSKTIEIYDQAGNSAIKSELSVNDIIYIKERVWSDDDLKFKYYLREGRIIEMKDDYITVHYLTLKNYAFEKNDIKVIKNKNMNLINYSDLKIGDKVYIINKIHIKDEPSESGEVVFPEATNTKSLKDVKLLQVLNK